MASDITTQDPYTEIKGSQLYMYFSGWLSMAFGNRWWLRVHHTKPSTLGWSVVVGLYKLITRPFPKAMDNQPEKYS